MSDEQDTDEISRRIQELQKAVENAADHDDCQPMVDELAELMEKTVEENHEQILDNFNDRSLETIIRSDGLKDATKEETLEFLKKAEDILKSRREES
jgi:hypothetical protein